MKLKVFGSGSSGNCYGLTNDKEILLLDAGIKYKEVLKGIDYRISDVVGVLCTHAHHDHVKYAEDFRASGIPVFQPYLGGKQAATFGGFHVFAFPVPHDGVECRGFLIKHEEIGSMVYLTDLEYCPYTFKSHNLRTMLVESNYSKDMVSDEDIKRKHVLMGHCEIETTLGIIDANRTDALQNVVLCHLSQESAIPSEFTDKAKEVAKCAVYVAQKGLEIEL